MSILMRSMCATKRVVTLGCAALTCFLLVACYNPEGYVPEPKLEPLQTQVWSSADVDALVERSYETIVAPLPSALNAAHTIPAACQNINYYRYKLKSASADSQQADAVIMLMPGIIEGANAFHYIARQLIYMAKTQRDMDLELWAVERRANCLEDLRGFNRGEQIADLEQAKDIIIDYYYAGASIDGHVFEGFYEPREVSFLADFGLELATMDMYRIMRERMPSPQVRREKLFVGGHSLGGIHASVFMAWDEDGSLATIDDAGYNNVAGFIGLDALIGDFTLAPQAIFGFLPFPQLFSQLSGHLIKSYYSHSIDAIRRGESAAFLQVPGFFTPEILALLEPIGLLAERAPNDTFTAIDEIPSNPALRNLLNFFQARDQSSFALGPYFSNFRYTNQAMLGLLFDDDFSALNLLHLSLGYMHGGAVAPKSHVLEFLAAIEVLEPVYSPVVPEKGLFVPVNAGATIGGWGLGPRYSWASYNEVASPAKPEFTAINAEIVLTRLEDEMVDIKDFYPALFLGESNLTEWYFPTRIVLDLFAIIYEYGQDFGLNTLHAQQIDALPGIVFSAQNGASGLSSVILPQLSGEHISVPNMGHLDPLFAVANNPAHYQNPILPKLLDFVQANTAAQ